MSHDPKSKIAVHNHCPGAGACAGHLVQFYRNDLFLVASLAEYVRLGLNEGQGVIILATREHQLALMEELRNTFPHFQKYVDRKQISFLDAVTTLEQVTIDGRPDVEKFNQVVGNLLKTMQINYKAVRFYGELVNILCEKGRLGEALELESYWNNLLKENPEIMLMCGYSTKNMNNGYEDNDFFFVSNLHSDTISAECVSPEEDDNFFRHLAALELRSILLNIKTRSMHKLENEMKNLKTALNQTGKLSLLGELCAGIAHELNNPLAVLDMHQGVLLERTEELPTEHGEVFSEALKAIGHASERMAKIVNGVLNFARQGSREERLFCVVEALDSAISFVAKLSVKAQVEIVLNVGNGKHMAFGSADQLIQVFVNIITNAKDAIVAAQRSGAGKLEITVQYNERSEIEILFKDNGSGMTPEVCSQVFSPFFTTKLNGKGTGLGMSIASGIIRDHRGQLSCTSQPGLGAEFKILLPSYVESVEEVSKFG